MFVTSVHFHPGLVFVGKVKSLPLEWSPEGGTTLVGSSLAHKYKTRVEVKGSGKHSSLLQCGNNYCRKRFYIGKCLTVTNTLAYYNRIIYTYLTAYNNASTITAVKGFIVHALGWKYLTATNMLAYYSTIIFTYLTSYYNAATIAALKGFIVHAPGGKYLTATNTLAYYSTTIFTYLTSYYNVL